MTEKNRPHAAVTVAYTGVGYTVTGTAFFMLVISYLTPEK